MKEKISCGICNREFDADERPNVTIGGYAASEGVAKALGIDPTGVNYVAICPECHSKQMAETSIH